MKTSFWSSYEGREDRSSDERPHLIYLESSNDQVLKFWKKKFWRPKLRSSDGRRLKNEVSYDQKFWRNTDSVWRLKTICWICLGQKLWWRKSWRPKLWKRTPKATEDQSSEDHVTKVLKSRISEERILRIAFRRSKVRKERWNPTKLRWSSNWLRQTYKWQAIISGSWKSKCRLADNVLWDY